MLPLLDMMAATDLHLCYQLCLVRPGYAKAV